MLLQKESFRSILAFCAFLFISAEACAQMIDIHPLAPADTSSPQATLRSFVTAIDKGLTLELKSALLYLASNRLYPNDSENALQAESDGFFGQAIETLDLSGLPSGFREVLVVEHVILLSEILSRLDLPRFEAIPDNEAMKEQGEKRWTIPNTQIEISMIEEGPRQGEYVFSASTVVRLGEFYDRVVTLPYKPGTLKNFVEGFRPYTSVATLYDIYRNSTTGFGVVPGRWMLSMPAWLTKRFGGIAVWQYLSLAVYLLFIILFVYLVRFICRKIGTGPQWRWFLTAVVVAIFAGLMVPLCGQLHISGSVLYITGIASVAILYTVSAWAAFIGAGAIAESIVHVQQLRVGAIDSQLIRLGARLIGLVIAITLLIKGAEELGFPAYSVLAGLGISGLAVAFAAKEALANLLGSIVIMFEKPFRSGHWIKVGEAEGMVEHVGFRSTRIRTFEDSLISIPNSFVVNEVVDNLGMRGKRRQRFVTQITYGTPPDNIEAFVEGIRKIIVDHMMTDKEAVYVHFNDLGESGLDILLYFYLRVPDYATELREREVILLRILRLARESNVEFAHPTRTLQIDGAPDRQTG